MKRLFALLLVAAAPALFAAAPPARTLVLDNNASCDVGTYPAATLLLPYFEVDFRESQTSAINTVFTITNVVNTAQIVRVTFWTDWGYPVVSFPLFLTGYDSQSISCYELIARGNVPTTFSSSTIGSTTAGNENNPNFATPDAAGCERNGGSIPQSLIERLQRIFTTGVVDDANCPVGSVHEHAVGYATVDVVNSCTIPPMDEQYWSNILLFDNVLTGDYERINPNVTTGNYAGGNPLVHIRAVPEGGKAGTTVDTPLPFTFYDRYTPAGARKSDRREPLPSVWAARFIQGGPADFRTNYIIWREGVVGADRTQCLYAKNEKLPMAPASIVRFDEHENSVASAGCGGAPCANGSLPVSSATSTSAAFFPPLAASGDRAGWMWISLDNMAGRREASPYSTPRSSQGWMTIQMYAEGRYAVDFDATALVNGCTANPPSAP